MGTKITGTKTGLSLMTLLVTSGSLLGTPALASQGPGIANGTAGPFTQLAMAILVYGATAAIGVVAVIRRARQR
jgi:hypothetical protein